MLPFSKRKKADEIELEDADIVVLEEAPVEIDVAELEAVELEAAEADIIEERPQLPRVSSPPKASLRRLVTAPVGRDQFEEDVAQECLESIAEATSRVVGVVRRPSLSDAFPASIVPPSPLLPRFDTSVDDLLADAPLPQFELSDTDETTRRPALSSSSSMPISRDSVPGVLPVPSAPMSVSSLPTPVFSRTTSSPNLPAASSIAPVSMNSTPSLVAPAEPTVILVRQPPKAAWVVAAAFLGAACALLGMRLLTQKADAPQTIVLTAPPPPATPQALTPAAPPPATVRFNDEQGVAVIAAPTTTVSAAPAPKPVVTTASMKTSTPSASKPSSLGPKLPDGSMALTKASAPPASPAPAAPPPAVKAAPEKPEPAAAPAPSPTQKRKLTPEQELAEAQLKASMK